MNPSDSRRDRAVAGILASNLLTLVLAWWQGWPLASMLWPYWCQSVVIGWFARKRILKLGQFSTEGFRVNGEAVAPTPETKRSTANFFALHYGFFHLAYLVFLVQEGAASFKAMGVRDVLLILGLALAFWYSHGLSHRDHVAADLRRVPNIGSLMFLPYVRIVPMHLVILFGASQTGGLGLLVFGALKTAADVLMHRAEHRWLQRAKTSRQVPRVVE